MIQSNTLDRASCDRASGGEANLVEAKLPRRDWILLPMLSLLTVCLLAGLTEFTARRIFTSVDTLGEQCMVFNDPATGARGIPNSSCKIKTPEGELTELQFNSCGHRTGMECGPKPPDTYRIVMMGSSYALGLWVPREKTYAALLPTELSRRTGRNIELYNESMSHQFPEIIAAHFNDALKAKPDMVLWTVTAQDMQSGIGVPAPYVARRLSLLERGWNRIKVAFAGKSLVDSISEIFRGSRTATLLGHFLYKSQSQYIKSSIMDPDKVWYLRDPPNADWAKRIHDFDISVAKIAMQAKDADVPVVVVLLPNHVQTDMVSMGQWPAGFNPYELDEALRRIITSHGGTYIDILPDIRHTPSLENGYFAFEGHPDERGHAIFAELLAKELTSGAVPALSITNRAQIP
jgi:hypothetical protein